ncbi:bacterial regulatory protein, luxR family [Streptomyces jeddahensis]|uniref:Bacterial regulatory protein, luxR family n=2 Tax=Streptomyces jeddahensis TaxID=1716141 RepID=A0A177HF59_9ACTN|nr:bacterial regulatory protein, luxR family [Streptomyces jeddahensis]
MRAALLRLRRATGLPVAFGGLVESGGRHMRISELSGTATGALRALAVSSGNGLGGKTLALSRPCAVTDYSVSRQISHEYDVAVETEGLRSVLAVPVVVRRRMRGVLYGALRSAQPLGDRMLGAAVAAARDVEQALVVREEAHALLAAAGAADVGQESGAGAAAWEQVREAHAELRALAPRVADPALRTELLAACARLATAATRPRERGAAVVPGAGASNASSAGPGGRGAPWPPRGAPVSLAPREIDVLACVATGATNATAADHLGVRPETVKGYLRSAMRKLGAHTRLEAVVAARRAGLLP